MTQKICKIDFDNAEIVCVDVEKITDTRVYLKTRYVSRSPYYHETFTSAKQTLLKHFCEQKSYHTKRLYEYEARIEKINTMEEPI
jgi:NADPH-dependent curcumin reductase CurA